jgi:hypothetical protein
MHATGLTSSDSIEGDQGLRGVVLIEDSSINWCRANQNLSSMLREWQPTDSGRTTTSKKVGVLACNVPTTMHMIDSV